MDNIDPNKILWKITEARLIDALERAHGGATPDEVLELLNDNMTTSIPNPASGANRNGGSAPEVLARPLSENQDLVITSVFIVAEGLDLETGKKKLAWDYDTDTPKHTHVGMLRAMLDLVESALFDELTGEMDG